MTTGLLRDNSIASANVTGASQLALALNGSRQAFMIQNNQSGNIEVNMSGPGAAGTAAGAGLLGSIVLSPGATVSGGLTGPYCPQNAINVLGTTNGGVIVVLEA
jgi:hypothetical protein